MTNVSETNFSTNGDCGPEPFEGLPAGSTTESEPADVFHTASVVDRL